MVGLLPLHSGLPILRSQEGKDPNGGRKKWGLEGRKYTKEEPEQVSSSNYVAQPQDEGIRAYASDVKRALERKEETVLVDVRSPKEFSGETTAPPEYLTEHAQREATYLEQRIFPGPKLSTIMMELSRVSKNFGHYMKQRELLLTNT